MSVYDGASRKRLCFLQNALNISYTKTPNNIWTGAFSLPYGDDKNDYCQSMNLVDIWDEGVNGEDSYVGLFRIMPISSTQGMGESLVNYELEHVISTLLDETLIGWHEVGNTGVDTGQVINYVLSQQSANGQKWIIGGCDYGHQYLYGWQDENLLSALLSITGPFLDDDWAWEYETRSYPWHLYLRKKSAAPVTDIRWGKNIHGVTKKTDPSNLVTRLYCYGYGEGENVLNIKDVNNGLLYIDSPNVMEYGYLTRTWTDERYTDPQQLFDAGKAMLAGLDKPLESYDVDIAAIHEAAALLPGDMVRVIDGRDSFYTRVVEVSKNNVTGEPYSGQIVLANKTDNLADSIANLSDRQRIETTYSQGAESIFADSLYDNANNADPATLHFIIPENAVHVNDILLTAKLAAFRAYATPSSDLTGYVLEDGTQRITEPGTTQAYGGYFTPTTYGGGSINETGNDVHGVQSGGSIVTTDEDRTVVETLQLVSGDNRNVDDRPIGNVGGTDHWNHNHAMGLKLNTQQSLWENLSGRPYLPIVTDVQFNPTVVPHFETHTFPFPTIEGTDPDGNPIIGSGSFPYDVYTGATVNANAEVTRTTFTPSGAHNHLGHKHKLNIPSHRHSFTIDDHTHQIYIPSHDHVFEVPKHTHGVIYGIYKMESVANYFQVYIDGVLCTSVDNPASTPDRFYGSVDRLNLIDFMPKTNGQVVRGTHTITIRPNALSRIECSIQVRLFTNARGEVPGANQH